MPLLLYFSFTKVPGAPVHALLVPSGRVEKHGGRGQHHTGGEQATQNGPRAGPQAKPGGRREVTTPASGRSMRTKKGRARLRSKKGGDGKGGARPWPDRGRASQRRWLLAAGGGPADLWNFGGRELGIWEQYRLGRSVRGRR
jgi:hypothetical protein